MVPAAVELLGDKVWWPSTATGEAVVLHEDTGEHPIRRRPAEQEGS